MSITNTYKTVNPFLSGHEFRNGIISIKPISYGSGTAGSVDTTTSTQIITHEITEPEGGFYPGHVYRLTIPNNTTDASSGTQVTQKHFVSFANVTIACPENCYASFELSVYYPQGCTGGITWNADWESADQTDDVDDGVAAANGYEYRYAIHIENIGGTTKVIHNKLYRYEPTSVPTA